MEAKPSCLLSKLDAAPVLFLAPINNLTAGLAELVLLSVATLLELRHKLTAVDVVLFAINNPCVFVIVACM
jgi:hypothetical protein